MKSKIQEIENDNFILKYIKDQSNKGIGPFALCKYKTSNKISFKFNFDYMLSNYQNCEMCFDITKSLSNTKINYPYIKLKIILYEQ